MCMASEIENQLIRAAEKVILRDDLSPPNLALMHNALTDFQMGTGREPDLPELEPIDIPTLGKCGVRLEWDPDVWEMYLLFGFIFSSGALFAEIEDGTYGQIQGFRFYLEA